MEYDLDALYLYNDSWNYRVGKIAKINDKSIRMQGGRKINKEDFGSVHKLTDEEIKYFNNELVKKLSGAISHVRVALDVINNLKLALRMSEFAQVDSKKLQAKLDILDKALSKELPQAININGKKFEFEKNSEGLTEVE